MPRELRRGERTVGAGGGEIFAMTVGADQLRLASDVELAVGQEHVRRDDGARAEGLEEIGTLGQDPGQEADGIAADRFQARELEAELVDPGERARCHLGLRWPDEGLHRRGGEGGDALEDRVMPLGSIAAAVKAGMLSRTA